MSETERSHKQLKILQAHFEILHEQCLMLEQTRNLVTTQITILKRYIEHIGELDNV